VQTPQDFIELLNSEINDHSDESLILVSHHPPYTNAHHGGKFPLKDDLFPLTQKVKWLYWPLPVAGFVFNRIRLRFSEQDLYHPRYKTYRAAIIEALEANGTNIVASGHEHTLQMIDNDNQHYIVSGAASKESKVTLGNGSEFAVGHKGYAKLIFQDAKNVMIQFIVPGQYLEQRNIAFQRILILE
jgi:hypothetical protein